MTPDADVAIAGSGFAGSLLACILRQSGLRVALLERGRHPRFVIGESTSPLANLMLEELAREYGLGWLLPLTCYGAWRRGHPELPVGLKRGFSFFQHEKGKSYARADPASRLLVAASPCEEVADTHWYRPALDQFLVEKACSLGADYHDQTRILSVAPNRAGARIECERQGKPFSLDCRWLIDAAGPRGLSYQLGQARDEGLPHFPATSAIYSHFNGVGDFDSEAAASGESLPFDADDAAQHHLFPGGWIWILRFENGVTSAGAALEPELAGEIGLDSGCESWRRLLAQFPSIAELFQNASPVEPWRFERRIPFLARRCLWGRTIMLPSAVAAIDPLFSTGIPLTLLGIQRLAPLLRRLVEADGDADPEARSQLREYERATLDEACFTARLVAACYRRFDDMQAFADLSMIYFAAASYSEAARRMGRPHLARRFLLSDSPLFRAAAAKILDGAAPAPLLAPFNLAGLCDPKKRGVYPVDFEDLRRSAPLLGASEAEMNRFIASQQARMESRTWPGSEVLESSGE